MSRSRTATVTYRLTRCRGSAEFVYYRLSAADFLFLPSHLVPARGTMFSEAPSSKYCRFKNTFDAFEADRVRRDSLGEDAESIG